MSEETRNTVLELMTKKDKLEAEINEYTSILTQNNIGMDEPLIDNEGYPINSLDIYQIRHARHQIICLQNDYKNLMNLIENGLENYYQTTQNHTNEQTTNGFELKNQFIIHQKPFARITMVSEGSPADIAGIQLNDQLIEFGSVNADNFKTIQDIATVVQYRENCPINIKLKRGDQHFLTKQIVPKRWNGRGLLGCNINPL